MMRGPVSLLTVALAGCLSLDPEHCANREGNATCEMLGAAPYCSICASENAGCVEETPSDSCYRPGSDDDEESSGSTTEMPASSSSASESTAAADCASEGLDESCPEDAKYCIDGVCSACTDSMYCAGLDAETPMCHPGSGACVGCVGNDDCSEGVCSDAFACVECANHSHCPVSNACDLRSGECFEADHVLWVDPAGCDASGTGTENDPYCTLQTAVTNIGTRGVGVVHYVASGDTVGIDLDFDGVPGRTLVLLGENRPVMHMVDTALTVGNGSVLFVDGVRVTNTTAHAVSCGNDGQLWLTDVQLENTPTAVRADGCSRLVLERSTILGSLNNAIEATDSELHLVSSALVDNGLAGTSSTAIDAINTELTIRYSTLADNRGTGGASIACTNTSGELRNSVIVSSDAPSIDCPGLALRTSVVDSPSDGEGVQVVEDYNATWFTDVASGNVGVRNPDASPFRNVAVWNVGDPLRDISGERRVAYPGLVEFAGADQP
jgi:hypothetical protein